MLLLLAACVIGCSRKKNTFISRNWHAVTAEYNTLFNGNMALELGKEELNQTYRDNYWDILPVERMQVSETVLAPGTSINPNFEVAEEKAVKAIQRHSMLLDGSEKNPQIDEAYLLLGKARYYDQRFVPALEAFNYILHKYPLSNTINEAKIWREKSNIRLEFNELAIKNLKKMLKNEKLEKENRANANAMLAEAYLNIGARDSAVAPLKKAAKLTDNKDEEGRYWFITGQLYDRLEQRDSSNYAYSQVIDLNRKIPRIYLVNAKIAQIRNTDLSPEKKAVVLEQLLDLSGDRENRPYLDQIYFELAEFHYQQDSINLAMDYYNRSLASPSENAYLQSLDYESLGNINFDAANYEIAGAYYDSTLQKLAQNTREYRLIKKKRDNLGDVIYYENLSRELDSVLIIAKLPEEEQREFFTAYTAELRERMESEAGKEEQAQNAQNYFETKRTGLPGVPTPGNTFYFYNPTTVAYGKQEFFRLWGNRELADNWRTGSRMAATAGLDSIGRNELAENDPRLDPETYLKRIPKDPALLDSLVQERNFANYQLGLIYREKFKENGLAAEKLESVLANDPEERLVIPSMYNLYKTYIELGELAKAQSLKNDIIFRFPDSRYAAILQDPKSLLQDENNPTALYEEVYQLYEDQQYAEVIERAGGLASEFAGDEIVPKLELLKAMAQGRLLGVESYKEGLNYVALNYPQSLEGIKAQEILQTALPTIANPVFKNDSLASSFKLVFPFEITEKSKAEELKKIITNSLEKLNYSEIKASVDVYGPQQIFVVVHNFRSPENALGYAELLEKSKENKVTRKSFYISAENYRIAQIHKNIDTYLETLNPPQ
ncbi:type IX secretion system periplasmic lipoprotein PorW/SprE [Salinimicrobium soli]|uniref:type IX secretion system periplasmic lipoprotein PorW/SprE n=1 Tax=Salinimicrobium soli TaxID=1254399 RepID=UPI003AB0B75E